MAQSIKDMDKYFLSTLKPDDVHWEHANFINQRCDMENCPFEVKHSCLSDYSADADSVKSLCDMHYNKDTQKKWLKRFKNNLI